MIDMESYLIYDIFDGVMECTIVNKLWEKLAQIHGGEKKCVES